MFIKCVDRNGETRSLKSIHINSEDIRRVYVVQDEKKADKNKAAVVAELRTTNIHKEVLFEGTMAHCEAFQTKLLSMLGVFEFHMETNLIE